jgi:hypothetical protein
VRNAEDGKAKGLGKPDAQTLLVDTAMRDKPTPGKVLRATKARGGTGTEDSVEAYV